LASDVHVDDVASALVLLTEEAIKGDASKAKWGDEGYYFTGAAEHVRTNNPPPTPPLCDINFFF